MNSAGKIVRVEALCFTSCVQNMGIIREQCAKYHDYETDPNFSNKRIEHVTIITRFKNDTARTDQHAAMLHDLK